MILFYVAINEKFVSLSGWIVRGFKEGNKEEGLSSCKLSNWVLLWEFDLWDIA